MGKQLRAAGELELPDKETDLSTCMKAGGGQVEHCHWQIVYWAILAMLFELRCFFCVSAQI